ncbi:hypothetical protein C8Q80DRAFT_177080 [Daedaleopsis nitida]|nr:hypothetical protein C8Q80DRAFT_177080 [Daedaleopsis nitida]
MLATRPYPGLHICDTTTDPRSVANGRGTHDDAFDSAPVKGLGGALAPGQAASVFGANVLSPPDAEVPAILLLLLLHSSPPGHDGCRRSQHDVSRLLCPHAHTILPQEPGSAGVVDIALPCFAIAFCLPLLLTGLFPHRLTMPLRVSSTPPHTPLPPGLHARRRSRRRRLRRISPPGLPAHLLRALSRHAPHRPHHHPRLRRIGRVLRAVCACAQS